LFGRSTAFWAAHLVDAHVLIVNKYILRITDPMSWYLTGFDDPGNLALTDLKHLGGLA
jgi:hypothetical protein